MKKKALRKDFRVEIRKSLNRFLSIFFIVALGVAFFSGIQAAAPSMRLTGDWYFDDSSLMDIRVMSTLGLTQEDIDAIREVEGISGVQGSYFEDVYCGEGDVREVLHVESIVSGMNHLAVTDGELPAKEGECFLDAEYAARMGYEPGDTLEIAVSDEEDSSLKRRQFTISGCGYSPTYLSFERGSTTLGTGALSGFVYVLPEEFDTDIYSVAYALVQGAEDETAFTDAYDDVVAAVYDRVEGITDVRCDVRYDEVVSEAQEKLDDARQEVEDGKKELEDAKKELEDGRNLADLELSEAESELIDGEEQLSDGKKELTEAGKEVADGEDELTDGEQELAENESTIADAKKQLADGTQSLEDGEQEYQDGQDEYDAEKKKAEKQLKAAQKKIDAGTAQLEQGWEDYRTGMAQIEAGEAQLVQAEQALLAQQTQYEDGTAQLAQGKAQYEEAAKQLPGLQNSYDALQGQIGSLQDTCAALESQIPSLQGAYDQAAADAQALRQAEQEANAAKASSETEYAAQDSEKNNASARLGAIPGEIAAQQEIVDQLNSQPELTPEDEQQLQAAQQRISELTQEQAGLNDRIAQLEQSMGSLEGSIAEYAQKAQEAAAGAQALEDTLPSLQGQIDAGTAALTEAEQGLAQAQAGAAELKSGIDTIQATKVTLDQKEKELSAAGTQLAAAWKEINAKKAELAAGKTELAQAKSTLETTQTQLEQGQDEINAGYAELKSAKKKLKSARKELDNGWAQLQASQNQLADGERQLEDGRRQLSDARSELADARQQILDGRRELAENERRIRDGWEDYEQGKLDAEQEIADGEQKILDAEEELLDAEQEIADAQQEIDELKYPEWYVDDRSALPEHAGFGENAERIGNLAQVIPVLFFLVAALISLTTMTRMVEEERTQIGTLKALGYSKWAIASKYLKYAFWATIGGSVLGVLVGEKLLPWVIINAYGIIYIYLPKVLIPYNWTFALAATGTALLCTIGATLSSCYRELRAVPAQLMRPPAPKQGKRVLLERIPFFWRHLSFSWKSTVRNLIRYKKRFLMTIFGIGGCMGLLLVGYGLQDSIMDIGILQFEELQMYDAMTILDTDASAQELQIPLEMVEQETRISQSRRFYMQQEEVDTAGVTGKEWYVYVYVPEDTENLGDFLAFRDRETKERYELTDEGAIITEKAANELGIEPGDVITLKQEDGSRIEVPVAAVCENYLAHYLYMTPALYEKVYGETPQYNSIFWKSPEEQDVVEQIGGQLLAQDAVLNITYTRTMAGQIDSMIGAMDIVMVVLIVSAGMLAFVVLYNLNNININERRRELATLKVLGFFDGEVAAYVYRENILLTVIGAFLGCVIGKLLHAYVITTVEVDACMFGRNINIPSFIYGTLFTIGFSVIVNYAMYFKLKKIDMVESLKSIE